MSRICLTLLALLVATAPALAQGPATPEQRDLFRTAQKRLTSVRFQASNFRHVAVSNPDMSDEEAEKGWRDLQQSYARFHAEHVRLVRSLDEIDGKGVAGRLARLQKIRGKVLARLKQLGDVTRTAPLDVDTVAERANEIARQLAYGCTQYEHLGRHLDIRPLPRS